MPPPRPAPPPADASPSSPLRPLPPPPPVSTSSSTSSPSPSRFTSLHIENAVHFKSLRVTFPRGLSTFIGGRGAGKSTALLLCLFAIGYPLSKPSEARARECLGAGRVTTGFLTEHGVPYSATRAASGDPVLRDASGAVVSVPIAQLFGVDFYEQKQIERDADDPVAQLTILDAFAAPDMRRIGEALSVVDRRLRQNTDLLKRLDDEIAEDEGRVLELPTTEAALANLAPDAAGDGAAVKKAHDLRAARGLEKSGLDALAKELAHVKRALDALAVDAKRRLAGAIDPALERGENGTHTNANANANAAIMRAAVARAQLVAGAIESAAGAVRAEIARAESGLEADGRALAAAHLKQDDEYQKLVARLDVDRERAAARDQLQTRFAELSALAKRLEERKRERRALGDENRTLVDDLLRLRGERFARRSGIAADVSKRLHGRVKVTVEQGKGTKRYLAFLTEILAGANIRPAEFVHEVAENVPPHELAAYALSGDPTRLVEVDRSKTGKEERALRVLKAIVASGRLFELQAFDLDDLPTVLLRVRKKLTPTAKVSIGERCTAILSILLLQTGRPLVVDQPEDHLDNSFVFRVFVPSVLRAKQERQVVFTSHNANVIVLGDSEHVVALRKNEDGGYVSAAGTVDEARKQIERILEGGRAAFLRRSERYGYAPKLEGAAARELEEADDDDDGEGDDGDDGGA